ncbi:MAG: TadE family protein [Verrucomicrobiota bacterium]
MKTKQYVELKIFRSRPTKRGQATVEFAMFAALFLSMTLVGYDLAFQVSRGQALASVARESARAYVSVKSSIDTGGSGNSTAVDSSDESDVNLGSIESSDGSEDPFQAAIDIAMQMVVPTDYADRENAKNNDTWNIFVSVVKRIDSTGTLNDDVDVDGDGVIDGEADDILVIDDSRSFPGTSDNFRSRFVTEEKIITVDGAATTYDVIKNPENYNLSVSYLGYLQTFVAVELFQEVNMISGLDNLMGWAGFDEIYEVAYY